MANKRVKVFIDADTKGLNRGIASAQKSLGSMGKKAAGAAVGFVGVSGAINELRKSVATVETLAKGTAGLARVTGMEVEEASRWVAVAKSRGIEAQKLGVGFTTLSKQIKAAADGSKQSAAAFRDLGVSQKTLESGNISKILGEAAEGMKRLGPGAERSALASKLFGKSYQALLPLLADGRVKTEEALAAADKYGLSLSKGQVASALQAVKAQRELNMAMDGLRVAVGLAVIPSLTSVVGSLTTFINQVRTGDGLVGSLAHNAIQLAAAFVTSKTAIVLVGAAVGMLTARFTMLLATLVVSKIAAFIGVLAQLRNMLMLISAAAATGTLARLPVLLGATGASLGAMAGPIGIVVGGLAGLAVAFGAFGGSQGSAAAAAQNTTDKLEAQRNALQRLRDQVLGDRMAVVNYRQAQLDVRDAVLQRATAEQEAGKGSDTYKRAQNNVRRAVIERTRSYLELQTAEKRNKELAEATGRSAIGLGRQHTRARTATENFRDEMRKLGIEFSGYPGKSGNVRSANKGQERSVNNLGNTWGAFVRGFAGSVNGTLTKLGVNPLSFSTPSFNVGGSGDRKAEGGYISGPSKRDVVPAMLGAGEAVVNLHQQPYVNRSMAFAQAAGVVPYGSLPELFSSVTTPNYYARGGIGGINEGGAAKVRAAARKYINKHSLTGVGNIVALGRRLQHMGYAVGEHPSFGGVAAVHAKNSYHYKGRALDVNADGFAGGEPRALDRLHSQLRRNSHVVELLWRTKGHFDHLHVAMNRGGFVSAARMGAAAIKGAWIGAGGSKSKADLMTAIAMAESGGDPGQRTMPEDSRGLWQIHWPSWGKTFAKWGSPYKAGNNAKMAKAILSRQGLSAWTVYNTGAYRQYLDDAKGAKPKGGTKKKSKPRAISSWARGGTVLGPGASREEFAVPGAWRAPSDSPSDTPDDGAAQLAAAVAENTKAIKEHTDAIKAVSASNSFQFARAFQDIIDRQLAGNWGGVIAVQAQRPVTA